MNTKYKYSRENGKNLIVDSVVGEERNAVRLVRSSDALFLSLSLHTSPLPSLTSYSSHHHHICRRSILSRCNLNVRNYFRQILNHVEMMLITNFERILIITRLRSLTLKPTVNKIWSWFKFFSFWF